ncbi:MAG: hypothetical protein R6V47_00835 [Candidatus Delongbacteria bacterium]
MFKYLMLYSAVLISILSCTTSDPGRLGTGRPGFGSLKIDEVSYFLSSGDQTFTPGEPIRLILRVKNTGKDIKEFRTEKNILLVLQIRDRYRKNLLGLNIAADRYIKEGSFKLMPSEERFFEISVETKNIPLDEYGSVYCQVRLFFLPRQFRRNALSVYLKRK